MTRLLVFLVVLGATFVGPWLSVAPAQVVAPPGNSGVDEYLEVVPEAGGDRPANVPARAGAPLTPAQVLDPQTSQALRKLGADGRAVAEVVTNSAPSDAAAVRKHAKAKNEALAGAEHGRKLLAGDGRGRVETMTAVLSGNGGGMGFAFPLILAATLAATLAAAVWRRRSRSG